jgi:glycerate 2-kinase
MPRRVLIVPDKFKGTLTASAAARAMARGWRQACPHDSLDLLPMSDGGDGFGEVTSALLRARSRRVKVVDAAHRPCLARWWWEPRTRTAIIESAAVIGLAMLPPKRFHPFQLDTQGLAAVVRAAAERGATRCLMGIGGSATNDGGFGLARGLGWRFLDGSGQLIESWTDLHRLECILAPRRHRCFARCLVATDVANPLLGPRGATRVYGPQKGLRPQDFAPAERCLGRMAQVVKEQFGRDFAREPGAGAAGGLGFGLLAFLGAELQPGFDLFARHAALERHLRAADLVITGEGALDRSTLMGKGVGRIAQRCRQLKIPCMALAGTVSASLGPDGGFTEVRALTELTTPAQAKSKAADWLERLARQAAGRKSEDRKPKAESRPKAEIRRGLDQRLRGTS